MRWPLITFFQCICLSLVVTDGPLGLVFINKLLNFSSSKYLLDVSNFTLWTEMTRNGWDVNSMFYILPHRNSFVFVFNAHNNFVFYS